jgi:thiol-disulfide isomerase/thioredoxin
MTIFQRGIVLAMLFTVIFTVSKAQDSLRIKGTIDKSLDGNVITIRTTYIFVTNRPLIKAECKITDGKFSLAVPAEALEQYQIAFKDNSSFEQGASLILTPGRAEITFLDKGLSNYTLVGNNVDSVYQNTIIPLINPKRFTEPESNKALVKWIEDHPESPLNAYIIVTRLKSKLHDNEILRLFKLIPPSQSKGSYYNQLKFSIDNLYVGQQLPDFEQKDLNDKLVKLSSFKGKYVLIDFWASWCIPCRAENPWLIEARKKFGHNKFDIISVSVDNSKDKWLAAIQQDGLQDWTHVSDLKGVKNSVAVTYQITAVPRNFLLDGDGKIIAKNLRGTELIAELNKLFK